MSHNCIFFPMIAILLIISTAYSQQCSSLVLSGGGSHGAYEAGVISGLAFNLPISSVSYNSVVGISAGAINSLGFAGFAPGDEQDAAIFLTRMWRSLDSKKSVLKDWKGGIVFGLLFHSSLFDSSPERETLTRLVGDSLLRNISVGSVNAVTGLYHVFNESIGPQGMVSAVMCSSAIPAVFPMQFFEDSYWMDGATLYHMDVTTGVKRCLEITNESNITIDMISCSPDTLPQEDLEYNTRRVMKRADEISNFARKIRHLELAMQAYPDVNFRFYIRPSQKLPGELGLEFDEKSIETSIKIGYNDAVNTIDSLITAREKIQMIKDVPIIYA